MEEMLQTDVCETCGHSLAMHAREGQGRSRLPCEHPNCECTDFKPLPDQSYRGILFGLTEDESTIPFRNT